MIEEQRLDGRLQQVPEVVATEEVGQFVGQDHLQLLRRQLGRTAAGRITSGRSQPKSVGTATSTNNQLHRPREGESLQ